VNAPIFILRAACTAMNAASLGSWAYTLSLEHPAAECSFERRTLHATATVNAWAPTKRSFCGRLRHDRGQPNDE
jgi:hypothetical protein